MQGDFELGGVGKQDGSRMIVKFQAPPICMKPCNGLVLDFRLGPSNIKPLQIIFPVGTSFITAHKQLGLYYL